MMSGEQALNVAGPAKVAFQEIGREKICHKNITWTNMQVLNRNGLHGLWKEPVLWAG